MDWLRFIYTVAVYALCFVLARSVAAAFPPRRGRYGVALGLTILIVVPALRQSLFPELRAWEARRLWAPLLLELSKRDPAVATKFHGAVSTAWRGIVPWDRRVVRLRMIIAEYFGAPVRVHISEASNDSALRYGRALGGVIHEVARQSPEACFVFLFSDDPVAAPIELGEPSIQQLMEAGVAVLQSSRESPQLPPDEGQVVSSLAAALADLGRDYPQEAALLQDQARLTLNRAFACRAMMLFYDVLLERKDATALRWVLSRNPRVAIPRGKVGV